MFGAYGSGTAPYYSGASMGQTPSAIERAPLHKASSGILREHSIQVDEELGQVSRPDSWSMHYDCTNQAPYAPAGDDKMMTTSSMLPNLPPGNPSRDLAFFLRSTGPTASHRRPSKVEHPRRAVSAGKSALRFLRMGHKKQPSNPLLTAHDKLNGILRDEGGLLMSPPPKGVEQRETSTGKRYLALQVAEPQVTDQQPHNIMTKPESSPDIVDSHVSISFPDQAFTRDEDDIDSCDALDSWLNAYTKDSTFCDDPWPRHKSSTRPSLSDQRTVRKVEHTSSPIRPGASSPPTPQPVSATSMAESYRSDLMEHPAKRSFDVARALSSHPVHPSSPTLTALPKIVLPKEESPVKHHSSSKGLDIKHPSPRRFASHPILLQRASSISSSRYARSTSDSPGPPPPRSPLRLRRDPRTIESIITSHSITRQATPKSAPTITSVAEHDTEIDPTKPSVITDCTGPIKRPKSRNRSAVAHPAYPASRKERDERVRARKLHERPQIARAIDAVVHAPSPTSRQRLRKPRPQIQIPDLRPAPLVTRASSSSSSNASWKKITESTRTPVSPVPSQGDPAREGVMTGYSPVSPTTSRESSMALSPVMLVAEEVPAPKTRSTPRPAKLVLEKGKTYAPRPRSASMSRNAAKRRSRVSTHTPSRSGSPFGQCLEKTETPPLPSPPPNRALPPTPPASGSERPGRARAGDINKKDLPVPPSYEIAPKSVPPPKPLQLLPHVATQAQRKHPGSKESGRTACVDARLEALERNNALLEAALWAVLKTNGSLNGPLALTEAAESPRNPMAWENRIARRSAASHQASSSNGSALEMYMSTRRGSRHGF